MPRQLAIASMMLVLNGCMAWHNPKLEPGVLLDQRRPNAVQVRRLDRSTVILYRPMVSGDSLVGIRRKRTVGIPLSEVSSVSVQRVSVAGTAVGILMLGAMVGLVAAAPTFTILE